MNPEQAFIDRLSPHDNAWLAQLWQQSQRQPPAHWVRWCMTGTDEPVSLGYLSPARAHWLQAHLRPMPHAFSGRLLWPSAQANCSERSQ